jgi:polar amino acid transport system permease protein
VAEHGGDQLPVVPVRHYGRWVGGLVVVVALAMLVHTLLSKIPTGRVSCSTVAGLRHCHAVVNWRFSWNVVREFFTTSLMFHGMLVTLELTVISMFIGITLGVVIAIMRLSPSRLLSAPAWSYTWFFRGTPVYVQIIFWYNIGALYQSFSLGVPFTSISFLHFSANTVFTPFFSAMVALGLNEAAYMSEIARAGLLAVDEGQIEAATSLGMRRGQTLRFVVLPQAMRVIIPPTGNEVISMLKTSSLASAISVLELLGTAQNIYAQNYQVMPLLITASLWYLLVTTVLSIGQFYLERHFAKGATRTPPPTPIARLRADVKGIVATATRSRRREVLA